MSEQEKEKAEEILDTIKDAEILAKDYEHEIRKGKILDFKSPYETIIEIYKDAIKRFEDIGWKDESAKLLNSIKYYEEKIEKDRKLRKIELEKIRKQKEFEESQKIHETDVMKAVIESLNLEEKILNFEENKEREKRKVEEIFNIIKDGERMAKDYEELVKAGDFLNYNCPYESIIEIYEATRKAFKDIGWNEESVRFTDSIQYYRDKIEEDKKLREIEKKKKI